MSADFRVDLSAKVAIVTGGSSGLGRAIAQRLAHSGATVVVGGRDRERSEAVVRDLADQGGTASAVVGDVSDPATGVALVDRAVTDHGGLDIVVNAAGVIHRGDVLATDADQWRAVMATNVDGVFFTSRAAVPALIDRGGGVIVNVSSTCGLVGAANLAAYCASKGAVTNLTRAMALDHAAQGIRINAICPGAIDTPMLAGGHEPGVTADEVRVRERAAIPQGEVPEPDEIAGLVLFLCSGAATHITGANLSIDGGYTAL